MTRKNPIVNGLFDLVILILLGITNPATSNGQTVLAEFKLPAEKINHIQSLSVHDKLFLLYDTRIDDSPVETKVCYQINSDGTAKKITLDPFEKMVLCNISKYDSNYYFYYLSEYHKMLTLQASTYNYITDKNKFIDGEIEIDGELWGTWSDDDFSLITYNRDLNQLKVLQVNKLNVMHEKIFDLPIDFSRDYKYMTYIPNNYLTTVEQGSAKFKLYKRGKLIVITIDQTFDESNTGNPQTVVIKLNLENGSQNVQNISAHNRGSFRSFLYRDKLYRTIISKKKYELNVFDIEDGNLISKKEFSIDSVLKESPVYFRYGREGLISKKETLTNMMKLSNVSDPSVVVIPGNDTCEATIIWGSYQEKSGIGPGTVNVRHPMYGILSMTVGTAMWQMKEPPGENRYFYMNENCRHDFEFSKPDSMPVRQAIDDHEILMKNSIDYKGYFEFLNKKIGVYLENGSNKLTLVSYDKH